LPPAEQLKQLLKKAAQQLSGVLKRNGPLLRGLWLPVRGERA